MLNLSSTLMAWIAGAGLTTYLGVLAYAILAPPRQHDPHRGMGVGLLIGAAIPAIVLAIVLAMGVMAQSRATITVAFVLVAIPMAYLLTMGIVIGAVRRYKSRHEWPTEPEDQSQSDTPV